MKFLVALTLVDGAAGALAQSPRPATCGWRRPCSEALRVSNAIGRAGTEMKKGHFIETDLTSHVKGESYRALVGN